MTHLLPLMLAPAATVIPRRNTTTTTAAPTTTAPNKNVFGPPLCPLKRRPAVRRIPIALPVLPYTTAEWAKAVADVKREYLNRRYRPCAMRCCEILDNLRHLSSVEPAYLIYLHFYAASAQEMQARSLSHNHHARQRLFEQARDHYSRAGDLIKAADASIGQTCSPSDDDEEEQEYLRPESPTSSVSSRSSSLLSPRSVSSAYSVSSASTAASSVDSPDVCKGIELSRPKKRVTFTDDAPTGNFLELSSPIIRPDSPTLGFSDMSCRSSPDLIDALPLPPNIVPLPLFSTPRASPEPQHPLPDLDLKDLGMEDLDLNLSLEDLAHREVDPFMRELSIHRYCMLLAGLQRQVNMHLSFIEADLAPSSHHTPRPLDEEERKLQLKMRIERLRAAGWQRQRFDAQRYEDLRENAIADLL